MAARRQNRVPGPAAGRFASAPAVEALLASGSYRGLRALLPVLGLEPNQRRTAQVLCDFALSIIDLDAEDWDSFPDVPGELRALARSASIPQNPLARERGALQSLVPTFGILQDVLAVRHRQRDLAGVLMVCHIVGEYLPILAWEPHLGHAADPPRLVEHATREGSLWGVEKDDPRSRDCEHPLSLRGSLREGLRVGSPRPEWTEEDYVRIWGRYLDRDHSRVASALMTCGLLVTEGRPRPLRACIGKCPMWRALPGDRDDLGDRLVLAGQLVESPIVALRHSAPVGHAFGVPSPKELAAAWAQTVDTLTSPWAGSRRNPLTAEALREPVRTPSGEDVVEPLPGLSVVISAVAGRAIAPYGIFAEVDGLIRAAIT